MDIDHRAGLPALDEDLLRRLLLQEEGAFTRLQVIETVDSTNQQLIRQAAEPDFSTDWPHLSVLTAEEQTGGTGRLGRAWSSPPRSTLSTSVVLHPGRDGSDPAIMLPWISLVAGLSLVEVLRERFDIPAELKWPNDVHVQGRKISGILSGVVPSRGGPAGDGARTGAFGDAGAGPIVVLGVGINVLLTAEELPTATSTSVLLELRRQGRPDQPGSFDSSDRAAAHVSTDLRSELLCSFLSHLAEALDELERVSAAGSRLTPWGSPLGRRIRAVMDTLGQQVRVELPGGAAETGTAVGLQEDGSLLVEVTHRRESSDGAWKTVTGAGAQKSGAQNFGAQNTEIQTRRAFSAGDVVHLRAAGT